MRPSPRWASASGGMSFSFISSDIFISVDMALDSFFVESYRVSIITRIDCDRFNDALGLRAHQVDRQQSVLQIRPQYLHAVRQHEGALELARGDAAVDVLPAFVVLLPAADDELALLYADIELVAGETRHRKGNAQPFRTVPVSGNAFDVVRRITFRGLADAVEHALNLVEAKQKGTGKRRNPGHGFKALCKRLCGALMAPQCAARNDSRRLC